jgi:hypothetical protein
MIVRAFGVRAHNKNLTCALANDLDRELLNLQKNGWNIISVTATPVKEYHYPDYFDSTLFTIVASKNEDK